MREPIKTDELTMAYRMARSGEESAYFYLSRKLQPLLIEKSFRFGGEAQFDRYYEAGNALLEELVFRRPADPSVCFKDLFQSKLLYVFSKMRIQSMKAKGKSACVLSKRDREVVGRIKEILSLFEEAQA